MCVDSVGQISDNGEISPMKVSPTWENTSPTGTHPAPGVDSVSNKKAKIV